MKAHYDDSQAAFYHGDVCEVLAQLPAESVQTVVTSPPYWGLRDYGQEGQLGLEPTPEAYVERMVAVFREVRRVLRDDGCVWLNLGDSYASDTKGNGGAPSKTLGSKNGVLRTQEARERIVGPKRYETRRIMHGLKHKDLVGIPWRVAFALQADGWYLRSDIIWAKPNPMPESVQDRPTKAHEYLFLLTKRERYYYNADAVREPTQPSSIERMKSGWSGNEHRAYVNGKQNNLSKYVGSDKAVEQALAGRNARSVWTIATEPYPDAHFAVFPSALIKPCILAGAPEGGVVLDPFVGSGTTAMVAKQLGRRAIGIDLSAKYLDMAVKRCAQMALMEMPS